MHLLPFRSLQVLFVCCVLGLATSPVSAAGDSDDPPARVARLSFTQGTVALQTSDSGDWSDASVNRPLTSGDQLKLEHGARAELQVGDLDAQLDEQSELSFLELNDDIAQIRLTQGALHLSVRRLHDNEIVEVDTPQAAVTIKRPGEYLIAVRDGGIRTAVKAFSGESEVSDHQGIIAVRSGEQANFFAAELNASQPVVQPIEKRNAFEQWAYDRSSGYDRSVSSQYVAPDVIGYRDLDNYGDWADEVDYGHVWYPRTVAVDWSPYRFGHWAWISPWGWTWVDNAPWGFAPFHYGRWAHVHGRWGWVPGPIHVHPVYAPALVAWVGAAPPHAGVSVSISFGSGIGWFPLAPREVFVPSYNCSRAHLYSVNYANTVIVNNIYINRVYNDRSTYFDHANRHVANAVTVMHADAFVKSRPAYEHIVRVAPRDLDHWQTRNAVPDVRPPHFDANVHRTAAPAPRDVVTRHTPFERGGVARSEPVSREHNPSIEHNDVPPARWNGSQNNPRTRVETNDPNRFSAPPAISAPPASREVPREPPRDPREMDARMQKTPSQPVETHPALQESGRPPTPRPHEFNYREQQNRNEAIRPAPQDSARPQTPTPRPHEFERREQPNRNEVAHPAPPPHVEQPRPAPTPPPQQAAPQRQQHENRESHGNDREHKHPEN